MNEGYGRPLFSVSFVLSGAALQSRAACAAEETRMYGVARHSVQKQSRSRAGVFFRRHGAREDYPKKHYGSTRDTVHPGGVDRSDG
jgi:hypothetical protein